MNKVDEYLIRNGYNIDGSKMNEKQLKNRFKPNKKPSRIQLLIAGKEELKTLKYEMQKHT